MTVTVADNHRDRIGKIYCDRDIKSDCSSVWDGKKESDRDSIVIEIMTETVTTALIETATQGLT